MMVTMLMVWTGHFNGFLADGLSILYHMNIINHPHHA